VDCSKAYNSADLTFTIGGKDFVLGGQDYVVKVGFCGDFLGFFLVEFNVIFILFFCCGNF
jgi:hypothetical protein